ncbi:hypothetical protein [Ammoniphilus sp. CFH 90114]|uniref:hypothetical protein n=1 Tax=Ammoniphilus sp. CFH 90114 TaxID=2493665 RepID=UPI00100DE28D|nr:hypothetical protein [Ammoniphilus sp. CFH 90114]RXT06246.1 hypothetical protein EIZ39_14250 [Ammoniphilus sp. CFH 90114]
MKKQEQQRSKKGYVLIGIGGIMLLGLLNLGFLIPFGIAAFLIYKGWNMIKGNSPRDPGTELAFDAATTAGASKFKNFDHLDEWEQKMNKA